MGRVALENAMSLDGAALLARGGRELPASTRPTSW
jgi:hypothetical protein